MKATHVSKGKPKPMQNVLVWTDIDGEFMWSPAWMLDGYPDDWYMSGWMEGADSLSIAHAQWWVPMLDSPDDSI